ncbi:MAG: carbohydrate ABC transporter permease [Caldilineaceae bacterium]
MGEYLLGCDWPSHGRPVRALLCAPIHARPAGRTLEAARLDGAGELTIFGKVVLPLTRPAIAVLVILGFAGRWNAFAWPLVALPRKEMFTVQLGINFMKGEYSIDYPALIAMVVVSLIPIVIVFLSFQKYFVQGIARTGIK